MDTGDSFQVYPTNDQAWFLGKVGNSKAEESIKWLEQPSLYYIYKQVKVMFLLVYYENYKSA